MADLTMTERAIKMENGLEENPTAYQHQISQSLRVPKTVPASEPDMTLSPINLSETSMKTSTLVESEYEHKLNADANTFPPITRDQAKGRNRSPEFENGDDVPAKKKKKRKRKSKNRNAPVSGFEEFYCDPPITPAEHEEELDIYHHSKSFVERIELCIQRYRARRKLDSLRSNIFNKYLILGGVDTSINAFTGGLDKETIEESTAAEIQAMTATDHIYSDKADPKYYNPRDKDNWVVDFESVARAFFSNTVPRVIGLDNQESIGQACDVIHNWLNYVLLHSVCPEHTADILAARRVCTRAKNELWSCHQVSMVLPGGFNRAASTLYGGQHDLIPILYPWTDDIDENLARMNIADAERIFKSAVAHIGSDKHFEEMIRFNFMPHVTESTLRSFEVTEIVLPDEKTKHKFLGIKDHQGTVGNIKPLGLIRVKHWDNPEAPDEDFSDDEDTVADIKATVNNLDPRNPPESIIEELWLEEHILGDCFLGMRFECTVHELNIGAKYFDTIRGIYSSFFTCLPNDLLRDWKDPISNLRPAPMAGDGNNQMDMEGELDTRLD